MKSLLKVSLLAATVVFAAGCQNEDTSKTERNEASDIEQTQDAKKFSFKNDEQKTAYAIGASFAKYINTKMEQPKELGVSVDKDMVLKGIEDVFAGKQELEDSDIQKIVTEFGSKLGKMAEEKVLNESKVNGDAGASYRAEYEKHEGVHKTSTGLLYKVVKAGAGKSPKATDMVEVNYEGKLIDGTKFDSSYDRGKSSSFHLNQVIPGWTEGVQLMKEGGEYEFVIPPGLAYGKHGTSRIPAESTLVFKVELLNVKNAQ